MTGTAPMTEVPPTGHPAVFRYLDLSTAHLPQQEMIEIAAAPPRVVDHEYGAFVHVPAAEYDEEAEASGWGEFPALLAVIRFARDLGVRWINFDLDADLVGGLPSWEW